MEGNCFVKLEELARGALAEKLSDALLKVADNIMDPNTEATAKRGITINIKFSPNKTRYLANATISVTTKLAPAESIDTQLAMGYDVKTGQLEVSEYTGLPRGQMSFADMGDQGESEAEEEKQPINLRNKIQVN